jgi:hypothetical protein
MNGACMAHFAKIENNVVTNVIVINNDVCGDTYPDSESVGQEFIANILGFDGEWKQTSYNHNFRKQYAPPGYTYSVENDIFIAPQPYPSWLLDSNNDWQPPVEAPTDGWYRWDEETTSWIRVEDKNI